MNVKLKTLVSIIFVALAAVTITSCITQNTIKPSSSSSFSFSKPSAQFEQNKALKFSIVVTATVMAPEAAMFEGGSWTKSRKMGHAMFAICHADGLLLLDTGLGRNIDVQFKDMSFLSKSLFSYEAQEPAADQFDAERFCPQRPMEIVLSHLHWDHASGVEDYIGTPVWVGPDERESALQAGNKKGYLQSQFDDSDINWKTLKYDGISYQNYDTSLDFFKDGSVVLVPMKGHTEGSVGLFLNMAENQKYFFTGDTTWSLEGFNRPAHKHALMRAFVDRNVDVVEYEIQRVNALMESQPSLIVIPAHDFQAYPQEAIYPAETSNR